MAEPLYFVVASDLRKKIANGTWPPGSRLPNEAELCNQYRVSRITVRHAMSILVNEGLVIRGRGSGSFVRGATITTGLRGLCSFTDEMSALGVKSGSRVLGKRVVRASDEQAAALGILRDASLLELRRLRTGDGTPVGLQTAYLPLARFPHLEEEDFGATSMYDFLEKQYGLQLQEAIETFWVGRVTEAEAKPLRLPAGSCAFLVKRITFEPQGPFEFVVSVMRADRYQVRIRLARA